MRSDSAFKAASWLYFPESLDPQYRVTILSNYSTAVVPRPGEQYSLMAEITRGPTSQRGDNYVRDVAASLVRCGLMSRDDIESVWEKDIDYSYPTPFLGRDQIVDPLLRRLESAAIFSRGRLGAWKYEVGNQDHSYMQGVEVIDLIEHGRREITLHDPEWINSRTNIPFPFPQWNL